MSSAAFVVSPAWMALSFLIAAATFVGNRFHRTSGAGVCACASDASRTIRKQSAFFHGDSIRLLVGSSSASSFSRGGFPS